METNISNDKPMFYRYEARKTGETEWQGICQAVTPDHRRKISHFLKSPKWYDKNPNIDSRCWLTQYGYDKYHTKLESIIKDCIENYYPLEIKLLTKPKLENTVMHGKVQCIVQITKDEKS